MEEPTKIIFLKKSIIFFLGVLWDEVAEEADLTDLLSCCINRGSAAWAAEGFEGFEDRGDSVAKEPEKKVSEFAESDERGFL